MPELVVSRFAEKAEYQKQTTDAAESQLEMIRKLHFSFEGHRELKEYCDSIGIQYLSAPFDIPSVRFLGTLGMPLIKIPSGEITNLPYLVQLKRDHRRPWHPGRQRLPGSDHSALQHPVPDSL